MYYKTDICVISPLKWEEKTFIALQPQIVFRCLEFLDGVELSCGRTLGPATTLIRQSWGRLRILVGQGSGTWEQSICSGWMGTLQVNNQRNLPTYYKEMWTKNRTILIVMKFNNFQTILLLLWVSARLKAEAGPKGNIFQNRRIFIFHLIKFFLSPFIWSQPWFNISNSIWICLEFVWTLQVHKCNILPVWRFRPYKPYIFWKLISFGDDNDKDIQWHINS